MPNLNDPKLKLTAFSHYHVTCRLCHGAPEYEPEEFAKGLYPAPPSMTSGHIQKARSEAEIYWIVKHGIKMTGMPAFGPTHEEKELWGLVALAEEIPEMSPEQYRQQVKAASSKGEKGPEHTHGESEGRTNLGHVPGEPSAHGEAE